MITKIKPENFNPKIHVAGCIIEWDNKILLLHRQDHKPEGDTWGTPCGKLDERETAKEAIIRETEEETGIKLDTGKLENYGNFFVRYATYDFVYHLFYIKLDKPPIVTINLKEHKKFIWETPKQALNMNLIQDEDFCIKQVYLDLQ